MLFIQYDFTSITYYIYCSILYLLLLLFHQHVNELLRHTYSISVMNWLTQSYPMQ